MVTETEATSCITKSQPFKDATNCYAVRNLLLHMHRQKKIKVQDPPENAQMRLGYYKSALLFIGMTGINVLKENVLIHVPRRC